MMYMESVKSMVSESNLKHLHDKDSEREEMKEHKDILDVIDTLSIISLSDSTLLQLDWGLFENNFCKELNDKSTIDIGMLRTIMRANLSDYLINIPVFEGLPQSKLELLSRLCHYSVEHKGSKICSEGEDGDEVFILLSGEVKVEAAASKRMVELFEEGVLTALSETEETSARSLSRLSNFSSGKNTEATIASNSKNIQKSRKKLIRRRQTLLQARNNACRKNLEKKDESSVKSLYRLDIPDPEHTVELAILRPGEYFGEISTFIEVPRAATITSVTNVLMASISKKSFRALYHTISPHLEADIEIIVKQHMLQTLLQSKSPFLEVIDSDLAKQMANVTTISIVDKEEVVFQEGEEADCFYFVYSGNLSVSRKENTDQERMVGSLYPGDYFGEMALMDSSNKRRATITSSVKTVLLVITKDDFHGCFKEASQLLAELKVRMEGPNTELHHLLEYAKSRDALCEYLAETNNARLLECYEDAIAYNSVVLEGGDGGSVQNQLCMLTAFVEKYLRSGSSDFIEFLQQDIITLEVEMSFLQNPRTDASISKPEALKSFEAKIRSKLESEVLPKFKKSKSFDSLRKRLRFYDGLDKHFLA